MTIYDKILICTKQKKNRFLKPTSKELTGNDVMWINKKSFYAIRKRPNRSVTAFNREIFSFIF